MTIELTDHQLALLSANRVPAGSEEDPDALGRLKPVVAIVAVVAPGDLRAAFALAIPDEQVRPQSMMILYQVDLINPRYVLGLVQTRNRRFLHGWFDLDELDRRFGAEGISFVGVELEGPEPSELTARMIAMADSALRAEPQHSRLPYTFDLTLKPLLGSATSELRAVIYCEVRDPQLRGVRNVHTAPGGEATDLPRIKRRRGYLRRRP